MPGTWRNVARRSRVMKNSVSFASRAATSARGRADNYRPKTGSPYQPRRADSRHPVIAVDAMGGDHAPDAIVVEMGLPYWQPPAGTCQSYLATYGASRANAQAAAEFLGLIHDR